MKEAKKMKRASMRFYLKIEDAKKLEEFIKSLKERGWRKGELRLNDLIIDELFAKAGNGFYEEVLNKFTPLEYLFKTKINHPTVRKEIEKILKRKV